MIEVKNISIGYERSLFKEASIKLYPGKMTLIQGPSGTGKSTLLYIIGMLLQPEGCHYFINHQEISDEKNYKNMVSYVLQTCDLIDYMSVEEHFDMVSENVSKERMHEVLLYVDLDISLSQQITTLSSGEKQRLAIALALINNTPVLLLDEPTAYLDNERSHSVLKLLQKITNEGKTVVISSHDDTVKEYADILYQIKDCQIISDKQCEESQTISHVEKPSKHYYISYLRSYVRHHKVSLSIMSLLSAICVIVMMMSSFVVNDFLSQQDQNLQALSTNQSLLVNEKDMLDYDENAPVLSDNILQDIKNINGVTGIYPYFQQQISYHDLFNVTIVSYISTDDFKDDIIKELSSSPYYVSEALYRVIKKDTMTLNDQTYQFGGVIDDDYQGTYLDDVHYVIYIPMKTSTNGNYIVTFDDYKNINDISNQIINKYQVSMITKTDTNNLTDSFILAKFMGNTFSMILIVLITIFLFIIVTQLSLSIKSSFVYLKTNCVHYHHLELSHILLIFIQSLLTFIICCIMQALFIFILNQMYHIQMNYLSNILYTFVFIIVYTLIIHIPMIMIIHFINPVKIMRKDN